MKMNFFYRYLDKFNGCFQNSASYKNSLFNFHIYCKTAVIIFIVYTHKQYWTEFAFTTV